jgi:hypothetical protein
MSRWGESDSRPTPSLTPSFGYRGARLYLIADCDSLVSRSGAMRHGLGLLKRLLTVIRDTLPIFLLKGAGVIRPTMELLYH